MWGTKGRNLQGRENPDSLPAPPHPLPPRHDTVLSRHAGPGAAPAPGLAWSRSGRRGRGLDRPCGERTGAALTGAATPAPPRPSRCSPVPPGVPRCSPVPPPVPSRSHSGSPTPAFGAGLPTAGIPPRLFATLPVSSHSPTPLPVSPGPDAPRSRSLPVPPPPAPGLSPVSVPPRSPWSPPLPVFPPLPPFLPQSRNPAGGSRCRSPPHVAAAAPDNKAPLADPAATRPLIGRRSPAARPPRTLL